jgi:hypothetical protein
MSRKCGQPRAVCFGLIASRFSGHCAGVKSAIAVALAAGLLVGCSKSRQGVYVLKDQMFEVVLELREDGSAALGLSSPALNAMAATKGTWKVVEYKEGGDEVVFYNDQSSYKTSLPDDSPNGGTVEDDPAAMFGTLGFYASCIAMRSTKEFRWEVQDNGDLLASPTGAMGGGSEGLKLQKGAPWKIHSFLLSEAESQLP